MVAAALISQREQAPRRAPRRRSSRLLWHGHAGAAALETMLDSVFSAAAAGASFSGGALAARMVGKRHGVQWRQPGASSSSSFDLAVVSTMVQWVARMLLMQCARCQ
jgi:hypothetical protein